MVTIKNLMVAKRLCLERRNSTCASSLQIRKHNIMLGRFQEEYIFKMFLEAQKGEFYSNTFARAVLSLEMC